MKVFNNIDSIIGNTPLYELKNIKKLGLYANVYAKLEFLNPAGSVKDRAAKFIIDDAENKGLISKGATIIEATSGNMGIGLAMVGASRGYKVILTMPDTMSVERINILKSFGAEVVLTDGVLGMKGSVDKAVELNKKIENSYIPSQFDNPANTLAHYKTTGPEIFSDLDGKVDLVVAGIGTGATISGIGKFLKEKNKNIEVVGVEPENSPLITKGVSGKHAIQGIGANFIPKNFDSSVCDLVLTSSDEDAINYAKLLAKTEGLSVGISSGAALSVAIKLAKMEKYKDKNVVVILPDSSSRYYSTKLFNF